MAETDPLITFLKGPGTRNLKCYAKKLGDRLLKLSGGTSARAEIWRHINVDEDAMQLIVTETIEVRISGPAVPFAEGAKKWPH